ncbi:MAG: protein jag [Candidatus Odinarchaeota archaeon]
MDENKQPPEIDGALLIDNEAESETKSSYSEIPLQEDGNAELACEMLIEILAHMDLQAEVTIRENAEEVVLDIQADDVGRIIGKKGQTLDALQFIINKIVNRFPEGRRHILIDCGDYRERRESGLASMARREAKRAMQQSRIITLEPMSPRDRRVIHLSLAKFPGVSTRSDGSGLDRRVRIIPSRRGSKGGGRYSRNREE